MYKIGICDDNEMFCWEMERYILDYCNMIHLEIETLIFVSGEELLEHWTTGHRLDLLLLDIELQTTNGISIGSEIRKNIESESTQIVFVSIRKDYAMQLFKIRPLDFLIKPVSYEDIAKTIDTFCTLFVNLNSNFDIIIINELIVLTRETLFVCRVLEKSLPFIPLAENTTTMESYRAACSSWIILFSSMYINPTSLM